MNRADARSRLSLQAWKGKKKLAAQPHYAVSLQPLGCIGLRCVISFSSHSRINASSSGLSKFRTASASKPKALRKITDCTPGGTASAVLLSSSNHHKELSSADCIVDFDCKRFPNSTQASSMKAVINPNTFVLVLAEACNVV